MKTPASGSVTPDEVNTNTGKASSSAPEPNVEVREVHYYHDRHYDRWERRVTGALTLIVIGIVLFLNTTGALSWSVWWEFIKFWPVFLITLGISLILGFSRPTKALASFLNFAIFVLVMFFAAVNTNSGIFLNSNITVPKLDSLPFVNVNGNGPKLGAASQHEELGTSQYPEASGMSLTLDQKIGSFNLGTMNSDNVYFTADVYSSSAGDNVTLDNTFTSGLLKTNIGTNNPGKFLWFGTSPDYEYRVSNLVKSLDLSLNMGAGQGTVDLGDQVKTGTVNAQTGAGELTMRFSATSLPQNLTLKVGAGDMTVNLPKSIAYTIQYHLGVGNITLDGNKAASGIGVNSSFQSANYNTAEQKTSITLDVGAGNFMLNTY